MKARCSLSAIGRQFWPSPPLPSMQANERKNPLVVTNEPIEFEKKTFWSSRLSRKLTIVFRGLYGTYLKLMKGNRKITSCDMLTLETPLTRSRPIIYAPKNLCGHWMQDMWITQNEGKLLYKLSLDWIN